MVWEPGPASAAAPPSERPPNIVVILADDLGWNDLSFQGGGLGGGQAKTPRIDSIAREGVSFTAGYSANATCAPSRAAILTGRYPTRSGYEFTPAGVPFMRGVAHFNRNAEPPPIYHEEIADTYPPREEQGLPASEITLAELLRERGLPHAALRQVAPRRGRGVPPRGAGLRREPRLLLRRLDVPARRTTRTS